MVLLRVLHELRSEHGWRLIVAHFNHRLRGRSSDADERFVRETAERLGIPFVAGHADNVAGRVPSRGAVKAFARQQNLSIEMAARRLRHDFLARTARERKAPTIALGHHADDQVELFFLRLLRGTSGEGLAGMKWSNPSPSDQRVTLVRPLLGCSRKEIEEFARNEKVAFREDQTNAALEFLRNRFRHELLPMLVKQYQPALSKTVLRLMDVLGAESELVTEQATHWLKMRQPVFDSLPVAVQRRALQLQLLKLGLKADFDRIEHLRLQKDAPLTLSLELIARRNSAGTIETRRIDHPPRFDAGQLVMNLTGKGRTVVFERRLKLTWRIAAEKRCGRPAFPAREQGGRLSYCPGGEESFDADKVGSPIALRHWRPGDRFQPIGMHSSVKLQDLFSNQKVPRAQRHQLTVATTAGGELFWVEGLRISEQFKLDKNTVRRLNWCWKKLLR